jgi:vacuolar-type H+-ATPase subunit H
VSTDKPAKRREIEASTAARLAEIVAAAERAAKQVIDEAEEEARTRLADAHEEADRIVAARLAGLVELTDEVGAQAEALKRQAEALQQALAEAKAEIGGAEALGGSPTMGRPEAEPASRKPSSPALTVVGGAPGAPGEPLAPVDMAAPVEPPPPEDAGLAPDPEDDFDSELTLGSGGTPAGARLLATQMAVSGSSRDEIESRLRSGFAITDTRAILDAILGPEQ